MKNLICGIVMAVSFLMAIGFIGGLEVDSLTVGRAMAGAGISLAVFWIAGKAVNIID